jgi:hypothetical protein
VLEKEKKRKRREQTVSKLILIAIHLHLISPHQPGCPHHLSSSPQITNPQQNRDFKRKQLAIDANRDLHLSKNVKFFKF